MYPTPLPTDIPDPSYEQRYEEVFQKSRALAHFSYVDSNKAGMVLDIQGSGFILTDPEVASVKVSTDNKDEHYFCGGNQNLEAIERFMKEHNCNTYCRLLGLVKPKPVEVTSSARRRERSPSSFSKGK